MRALPVLASALVLSVLPAAAADEPADEPAACSAAEQADYRYRLRQAIVVTWTPPRRASDIRCTVVIVQNFRGEVLDAGAVDCGTDLPVEKSVEDAAYQASPLPLPANRACLEPEIRLWLVKRAEPAGQVR
ncbi:MAG: hypothetical protein R3315_06355 [Woeseiaceae bacterium]|nr:hypothetical protein [Woeseiaceae bacterium]